MEEISHVDGGCTFTVCFQKRLCFLLSSQQNNFTLSMKLKVLLPKLLNTVVYSMICLTLLRPT